MTKFRIVNPCHQRAMDKSPELIQTSLMQRLSLAFNTQYGRIICLECGLFLSDVANHIAKKHGHLPKEEHDEVMESAKTWMEETSTGI